MYQAAPSIWTIRRDEPVILEVPFLSSICPTERHDGFAEPYFHICDAVCVRHSQVSIYLCALLEVSNIDELTIGPSSYLFWRVPPQPNCPHADVLLRVSVSMKYIWCYIVDPLFRRYASSLPDTLCIQHKNTTTSCSKGLQGLRFPLGVPGLCTRTEFSEARL